ncbi:CSU2 [Symbiodinium natans]|uniref:CSU2 protein n=1 Tax=Symbiodinium natans TaxID=878477 RepID=A0A812M6L5_9DINO|nr:CSU2 [Symbiodinium natans]
MFKNRGRPKGTRRKVDEDDEDEESETAEQQKLQEVRLVQKEQWAKPRGVVPVPEMMKQPEEEEEEEDKEQWGLLEKSFSGTAGQKGPDHHLEAYLNERLYNKGKEEEETVKERSREERLYEVPANLQVPDAAESQVDKMSWVAGLAEVALPVEYKLKNIEATEKAKREYLYGEHANAKPGAVIETDAVTRKAFGSRFMNVDKRDDSKATKLPCVFQILSCRFRD